MLPRLFDRSDSSPRPRRWLRAACCGSLLGIAVAGCGPSGQDQEDDAFYTVEPWPLPTSAEAAQPDLAQGLDGQLLLSWLQPDGAGGHQFQLGMIPAEASTSGRWTTRRIASGDDWFVNWADTPHIWALPDGSLWAHWLRQTGPGRMDYGIDLVRSGNRGASWTSPRLVNLPGVLSDHGFVTFWTQADDALGIAWLDSRQKAHAAQAPSDGHAHQHDHAAGPMMLRAGVFGADAEPAQEWPLDGSTCDCCPTASAMTSKGPVVVYRGRSGEEIRDMRIVRLEDGEWTAPRSVHDDGWKIAGCPVNGPVAGAHGEQVWVAWYTEGGGVPALRVATSDDAGDRFGEPVELARGRHVLGRPALATDSRHVLVAWLEEMQGASGTQRLMLARMGHALGDRQTMVVATLQAKGRASGHPRLVANEHGAWMVWVDVEDARARLRGVHLR